MSLGRWADKPWMRPTMYTSSESDQAPRSELQAGERSAEDIEAILRGDSLSERDGRMPLADLGDGRPDPTRIDTSPMIYRDAKFSRERALDLDDRDEPDQPLQQYEEYRPVVNVNERPKAADPVTSPVEFLADPKADIMLATKLLGIYPTKGGGVLVDVWISGMSARVTPDDLEATAHEFLTWAKVARTIKV